MLSDLINSVEVCFEIKPDAKLMALNRTLFESSPDNKLYGIVLAGAPAIYRGSAF